MVCIVKAIVFSVVIYRCESWTIKKAECQRIDAFFWTVVLEKTLESPLNSKEIKSVNPKGNQPWIFIGRTELKLQYFGHLMQKANSLEKTLMLGKIEGKRWLRRQRMRWLGSITESMDMNLSKFWEIVEDRGAWQAVVYGISKSRTRLSNWTTATI